jgi:hypothetical protein
MSSADADDRPDELTERYRAASAADPARPGDAARRSILAHARTVAADHATQRVAAAPPRSPAANDSRWPVAAAASVVVAALATVLAWRGHGPTPTSAPAPKPASPDTSAHTLTAAESAGPSQPSEPLPMERGANTAPAPNAVTARSRQRTVAQAEAPRIAHDVAADLEMKAGSAVGSQQMVPRTAPPAAAENAAPGGSAAATAAPAPAARASKLTAAPDSPLVKAAESGNLERVDQLLRSGSGTEQTDVRGRTALLIATLRGDLPMVRRLLASGARADVVDEGGDTPLAAARRQGSPELVTLLEQATQP